jgi:hypothetical protein
MLDAEREEIPHSDVAARCAARYAGESLARIALRISSTCRRAAASSCSPMFRATRAIAAASRASRMNRRSSISA